MVVESSVRQLAKEFQSKPLDFFLESDFQARLYGLLREELHKTNSLSVEVPQMWHPVEMGDSRNKTAEYIQWLKQRVEEQAQSYNNTHLTRVHTEVWVSEQFEYKTENKLDTVILTSGEKPFRPVQWQNGKQKIEIESTDVAIELKYLRDRTTLRNRITDVDPKNATKKEIANSVDLSFDGVQKDIDELERIGSAYSGIETYFVFFSNYDFLYRGDAAQTYLPDSSINRKIGDAVQLYLEEEYSELNIFYGYPDGAEWLLKNRESTT